MDNNTLDLEENIKDCPGYHITRDGILININTLKVHKWYFHHRYYRCKIGRKNIKLHRILAEAYIPNPHHYPLVRHLNGDAKDNRLENLAWGTDKDNRMDAINMGINDIRGKNNPGYGLVGSKNFNAKLSSKDRKKIHFLFNQGLDSETIWYLFKDKVRLSTIKRIIYKIKKGIINY